MHDTDPATLKARLQAQLQELEARSARIAEARERPLDADFEEQAAEAQDDEPLCAQELLIRHEIASLRRALDRIAAGTYGACVRCGEAIAPDRLAARPEAALCIACARTEI